MNDLEKAAIAWVQAIRSTGHDPRQAIENLSKYDSQALGSLCEAALGYETSLSTVSPGLDPTPVALAREVLSAAKKATTRPWFHGGECGYFGGNVAVCKISGPRVTVLTRVDDAAFIVAACNAAETLARAVLEGEERERLGAEYLEQMTERALAADREIVAGEERERVARERIGELEAKARELEQQPCPRCEVKY